MQAWPVGWREVGLVNFNLILSWPVARVHILPQYSTKEHHRSWRLPGIVEERDWTVVAVEIYSSMFCPFCSRAKHLLRQKGVEFTEIDVDTDPARRKEMLERANGLYTVPQIFIGGYHIGGSDDLDSLNREGKLSEMLDPS